MRRSRAGELWVLAALTGCGPPCLPLDGVPIVDPTGEATDRQRAVVRSTLLDVHGEVGSDAVCLSQVAFRDGEDLQAALEGAVATYAPDEREVSLDVALPLDALPRPLRHEVGHAWDHQHGWPSHRLTLPLGPEADVVLFGRDGYDGMRREAEAFAELFADGPAAQPLRFAVAEACADDVQERAQNAELRALFDHEVFPGEAIGWSRVLQVEPRPAVSLRTHALGRAYGRFWHDLLFVSGGKYGVWVVIAGFYEDRGQAPVQYEIALLDPHTGDLLHRQVLRPEWLGVDFIREIGSRRWAGEEYTWSEGTWEPVSRDLTPLLGNFGDTGQPWAWRVRQNPSWGSLGFQDAVALDSDLRVVGPPLAFPTLSSERQAELVSNPALDARVTVGVVGLPDGRGVALHQAEWQEGLPHDPDFAQTTTLRAGATLLASGAATPLQLPEEVWWWRETFSDWSRPFDAVAMADGAVLVHAVARGPAEGPAGALLRWDLDGDRWDVVSGGCNYDHELLAVGGEVWQIDASEPLNEAGEMVVEPVVLAPIEAQE